MLYLVEKGINAKKAAFELALLNTTQKNHILLELSKKILQNMQSIIDANLKDIENAKKNKVKTSMLDRLKLDENRISAFAEGLIDVAALDEPIGEVIEGKTTKSGLKIIKKTVPMGVIAVIYEARPNVTADVFGLCLKAGSATILRGGSDAINSNIAIVKILREGLDELGYNKNFVQLIENPDRSITTELMKMNKYVDLLIPRGGAALIKAVLENSTVPVIETGTGNCHIYVDEFADFDKALPIIINAKTQRNSVCNACETLLVHENIANKFMPKILDELALYNVEIRGCAKTLEYGSDIKLASENDFATEFLDAIIAVKIVKTLDEAIEHINEYSTKHSESIVTENYTNSQKFLNLIDAAVVYTNASTRFTDGFEFGLGAEIGISTQKLHARGPMGIKEITSYKYIVYGDGNIREN